MPPSAGVEVTTSASLNVCTPATSTDQPLNVPSALYVPVEATSLYSMKPWRTDVVVVDSDVPAVNDAPFVNVTSDPSVTMPNTTSDACAVVLVFPESNDVEHLG